MISYFSWSRLLGVLAFVVVVYASLMLPAQVERMRTGHWFTEHFIGYFIACAVICLGWRRRFVVARNAQRQRDLALVHLGPYASAAKKPEEPVVEGDERSI